MKRDMSLIRDLLTYIEAQPAGEPLMSGQVPSDVDGPTLGQHIELLCDRNLIEGEVYSIREPEFIIYRLTWEGHDFLQAIKNDTVWKKVLSKAKELGGVMTLDLAVALGKKYLMELAGLSDAEQ